MGAEQSSLDNANVTAVRPERVVFLVNGKECIVKTDCDPEIGPYYLLVDYIRDKLGLSGTKYMCREGGCGACTVVIKSTHPYTGEARVRSVNSCLVPLFACDGYEITTIEALGNRRVGYDPIQQRLVNFGGTQCGFCTPGFVMTMHSIRESNPRFTTADVENSLDGNVCRCTGYRPILDAFKSLSVNSSEELSRQILDIEELNICPLKPFRNSSESLEIIQVPKELHLQSANNGVKWIKVIKLATLFQILDKFTESKLIYRLVAGNTGTGVYDDGPYDAFVDINNLPELQGISLDPNGLELGGGTTLSSAVEIFLKASKMEGFVYARAFYNHFKRRVAGLSIRNQGTLAGNLMLKHNHRDFPSDVFVLFESVGATIRIGFSQTLTRVYTLLEFLDLDMNGKVIMSIHLPVFNKNYVYRCFKIGKRHQQAYAYVNCGFLCSVDSSKSQILDRPRICYGGINPYFVHANLTEEYLHGKQINTPILQNAMKILGNEVEPDNLLENGSPAFRIGLAQSYLYKVLLGIRGGAVSERLRSGSAEIKRYESKGQQTFDTDRKQWPLNQPVPKLESFPQSSGEAEYINDIRPRAGELHGAFVLTTVANATIKWVDASKALMMPGVVAFITAKDIPGTNNHAIFLTQMEEIFVDRQVRYAGQPVGLLLAVDKYTAFTARSKVVVKYDNVKKPILTIKESMQTRGKINDQAREQTNLAFPCKGISRQTAKTLLAHINKNAELETDMSSEVVEGGNEYTVKGEFSTHPQYHFHMETQICICVPNEDGMDVYSSTQHMDSVQASIASCLNVPNNSITVHVRRLGGAFGAKVTKQCHIATACALAAHVTHRPVRVALDLQTNMHMIGKRLPYLVTYEAVVNDDGKILSMDADVYCDTGAVANEPTSLYGMICLQSCYKATKWNIRPRVAVTDTAPNTFCRAPGSAQAIAAIETIMEHIAYTVKRDPLEVRQANFISKGDPLIGVPGATLPLTNLIPGMIDQLKVSGDYDSRKRFIDKFNQENRWKKRGISVAPQRFPIQYPDLRLPTFVSVYHVDGTVNVSHGGIEMGQGINTKVAQVVAHTLGIPLDTVKVKPSNNIISPNTAITCASVSSELVCNSARLACLQLLENLEPVRRQLGNPTWQQLITAANAQEILLTSQFQDAQGGVTAYDIWGLSMIEVEVDVLTGDFKIVRADILEDPGKSISPLVDVGQVEGAFIMGLSFWLNEELIYDKNSGQLLTDSTWVFKPMLASDIPEHIEVVFLRNAPNPYGVLSSKATGEPPLNTSCCVLFALRNAIDSARREVGNTDWYQMNGPVTREIIRQLCLTSPEQFIL